MHVVDEGFTEYAMYLHKKEITTQCVSRHTALENWNYYMSARTLPL